MSKTCRDFPVILLDVSASGESYEVKTCYGITSSRTQTSEVSRDEPSLYIES
jgi:hypothetical protein